MSNTSSRKHQASLSIEELFQEPSQHQQNWLLTYIDVFVLIVMLVITLIALSDFETEQNIKKSQSPQKQIKKPTPTKKTITKKSSKKISNDNKPKKEAIEIREKRVIPEPIIKQKTQDQILESKKPELPKIIEQKTASIEPQQKIKPETAITEPQQKKEQIEQIEQIEQMELMV